MNLAENSSLLKSSEPGAIDAPGRRRLPVLLRRAWYGLNQAFRRRIAHTKVTPDQFTVMRTLMEAQKAGLTQRELSNLMSSDPNTIASLLERMQSSGWVQRKTHESDRRANRILLTAKGRKQYGIVRQLAVTLQSDILMVLPEARREEFLEELSLVADACRKSAESQAHPPQGKSNKQRK